MPRHGALTAMRCAVALTGIGASAALQAQESDILSDFRLEGLPPMRDRFVTVRERPQPAFDPVPYRLGTVILMPRASVRGLYDSNIFAVSEATGDVALRGTTGAEANWSSGGLAAEVEGEVERRQYLSNDEQSTTDYLARGALAYSPRRDTALFAGGRLARETEGLADPAAPLNSRAPIQYDSRSAYLGAARGFGRLRLAGRVGAEDRSYGDGIDAFGAPIDQGFRNRTLYTADIGAEYVLGPDRSVFATAAINQRDYRNRQPLQPDRNSRGYRIEAGAAFTLTPLIRARVGIGYFRQDFRDPAFTTVSGLAVRGRIDYQLTQLLTLSVTGSRGVEEASTIGTGAYVATRVGAQADYELLRNLILSASASLERDRFQDLDRRYTIRRATLGAAWRLSPRYRVDAAYELRDQDSAGLAPGRAFVRHQFTIGVTVQGM